MNNRLYRQISVERLSSPEQLDEVLRFTSAREWVALTAIFLLLAVSLVWGYKGHIASEASGHGVIVRRGGVLNISARASGLVLKMTVRVGDHVAANQVVATIAQPVLVEQMKATRSALQEALHERERSVRVHKSEAQLQIDALERQRSNAELQITELQDEARLAADQISAEQQLLNKGLVTKQQVIGAQQKLVSYNDQIANLKAQLKQFDAQKFTLESRPQEDDAGMRMRISNLQRDLAGMEKQLSMAETVTSPYAGEVLEMKVYPGSLVELGQPLFSIQPDEHNLELLAYVPSLQAKDMRAGMEVQVAPSNIKPEEFGFMRGDVVYVADYPATPAAMMRNFENESLVNALTSSGPVTEIRATLRHSDKTPSGFQWSTAQGPNVTISSGTICAVEIITKEQRPVSLIFPYLKRFLGMG
jgi:HlyD family secretion protein